MSDTDLPAGPELNARIAEVILGREVQYIAAKPFSMEQKQDSFLGIRCNFGGAVFTVDRDWLVDAWLDVEANLEVAKYSTDIAAAWEVHREIQNRPFSIRQKYYHAVQVAIHERLGHEFMVGWPDVFGLIEPVDICRAAQKVVEEETCPASP